MLINPNYCENIFTNGCKKNKMFSSVRISGAQKNIQS